MIKFMLTFVNSGFRKTMIINMLNIIPKHPKTMTITPLTTRSNNSVDDKSIFENQSENEDLYLKKYLKNKVTTF